MPGPEQQSAARDNAQLCRFLRAAPVNRPRSVSFWNMPLHQRQDRQASKSVQEADESRRWR